MQPGQPIHVEVFTEDTGKQSFSVVKHLLRCIFRYMEPGCQMQRVMYGPATQEMERARGKNFPLHRWKSKRPVREQAMRVARELGQELARLLLQGRYVFYHLDSDKPWDDGGCFDAARDFHDIILPSVFGTIGRRCRVRQVLFVARGQTPHP
jgi:hypothetical protein